MHGSVAVRRASGPLPPLPAMHHFPPIAVDSLHHHHANNHNSHQHMARIKAGVARTSSSSASSSSVSSSGAGKERLAVGVDQRSSSASSSGVGERLGSALERRSSTGTGERSERLTPRRFLEKYSLPRVVRVVAEPGADRRLSGPLAQPLLLYRQYSSCKVVARSLRAGKPLGKGHAGELGLGPPLVIPDTYQGWFSLVRERSLQTRAKVYSTLQQLVSARVAVFLTKNPLTGFKLAPSSGPDGELAGRRLQYARSGVHGGQVLRLLAVFEDNENGRSSTRSRRGRGLVRAQQYAQCLTARSESVFVPVSTSGTFYAVATEDSNTPGADVSEHAGDHGVDADLSRVYQLPQLLRLTADPLPVKVQLVCGPIQNPLPTGFSGLLVLEDLQQEDVILACTLPRSWALPSGQSNTTGSAGSGSDAVAGTPSSFSPNPAVGSTPPAASSSTSSTDKPVFLEMDADSKFLLMRPLASREAEARFFKTPLLRRVLAYCRDRADVWSSQIKVTHHVFPTSEAGAASGKAGVVIAASASSAAPSLASTKSPRGSAVQGLFRSKDSALGGKESSLSSGGTKKSQSFRYASPAMMVSTASSSSSSGSGAGVTSPAKPCSGSAVTRQSQRAGSGTHPLLQQLQSLPGIKNFLRRSSSVSPAPAHAAHTDDVPLSVVFPELFGHQPPADPCAPSEGGGVEGAGNMPTGGPVPPAARQHLRFYADDLPYGRVADAINPESTPSAREYCRDSARRRLYDESEDQDDDPDEDHHGDDSENIYAEICECPRGVVVSGARVILTTACSEERRGYFTFASATSKDQYYTGGSDGTFSGTMSSSNPSNPEEDIYDTVC